MAAVDIERMRRFYRFIGGFGLTLALPLAFGAGQSAIEAATSPPAETAKVKALIGREAAIGEQLKRAGDTDTLRILQADSHSFVAIAIPARKVETTLGGALVLPSDGMAVTDPLPVALGDALPTGGWWTVLVQTPLDLAEPASGADDALCARIAAGLGQLKEQQVKSIVLVGIGAAFDRALTCYKNGLPPEIIALASLGRWQSDLKSIDLPGLDMVPSGDPRALAAAARRQAAQQGKHAPYRQIVIDTPTAGFLGGEHEAAKRVRGWLGQLRSTPNS